MNQSRRVVRDADLGGCHGEGAALRGDDEVARGAKVAGPAPDGSFDHGDDRRRTVLHFAQQGLECVEITKRVPPGFRDFIDVMTGRPNFAPGRGTDDQDAEILSHHGIQRVHHLPHQFAIETIVLLRTVQLQNPDPVRS